MIIHSYLEHIDIENTSSIKVNTYVQNKIAVPVHYHPEHEMVYIIRGKGRVYVGNSNTSFNKGELFIIGSKTEHWFEDEADISGRGMPSKVVVVQFRKVLFESLWHLPEFEATRQFLLKTRGGIKLKAPVNCHQLLADLQKASGVEKFNKLSMLLDDITRQQSYTTIMPEQEHGHPKSVTTDRIQQFYQYISENFDQPVTLDTAAARMHMSKTSLCRFLRRETARTFSEHLNFVRIGEACNMLRTTAQSVTEVCYAVGFNNAAYFFRQFKKLKKQSPYHYKMEYVGRG